VKNIKKTSLKISNLERNTEGIAMQIDSALTLLIHELGLTINLSDLKLDDEGGCAIRLDKKLVINLQCHAIEQELWFYADMGPPATSAQAYKDLLRSNLFWAATNGATFSLSGDDPHHTIITLPVYWPGLDGTALCERLETFVNTVEKWSQYVQEGDVSDEAQTTQPDPAMDALMSRA
jgi:hypothetical protein